MHVLAAIFVFGMVLEVGVQVTKQPKTGTTRDGDKDMGVSIDRLRMDVRAASR